MTNKPKFKVGNYVSSGTKGGIIKAVGMRGNSYIYRVMSKTEIPIIIDEKNIVYWVKSKKLKQNPVYRIGDRIGHRPTYMVLDYDYDKKRGKWEYLIYSEILSNMSWIDEGRLMLEDHEPPHATVTQSTKPIETYKRDGDTFTKIHEPKVREIERMPKIKNVVFRPDIRRVTIVFDGFATRATCKEGEEYRPLLGFLIAYFKAVKKLQGWSSKMVQNYFNAVLFYMPPEEQEAYLKAVYFENAKPTFKQALELFDDVETYWEKRV